jgi:hypothetical protein
MNNKNYNGVTIEKSWSLVGFAKEFGTPKFANCTNNETGEQFNCLAFEGQDGELTFCHFGYSTEGMTIRDIINEKDNLKVGLNSNGKYSLYKQENAWATIDLGI